MSARDRETAEAFVRLAASLDGAVLGLGTAVIAITSWVKYLAAARELRLVASATATSIAVLRSILPEDGEPRLVAVRGFVCTLPGGSYLKAPDSGEYGVITQHTLMVLVEILIWESKQLKNDKKPLPMPSRIQILFS